MNQIFKTLVLMAVVALGGFAPAVFAEKDQTVNSASEVAMAKVNVNTASAEELSAGLNGIGAKKAEAIVAYRTENGPFKTADELADVKGIGKGILQRNADRIAVE